LYLEIFTLTVELIFSNIFELISDQKTSG